MPVDTFTAYINTYCYLDPRTTPSDIYSSTHKPNSQIAIQHAPNLFRYRAEEEEGISPLKKKIILCDWALSGSENMAQHKGWDIFRELKALGFELYIIHPSGELRPFKNATTFQDNFLSNRNAVQDFLRENAEDEAAFHVLSHREMQRLIYAHQASKYNISPAVSRLLLKKEYFHADSPGPKIETILQDPELKAAEALEVDLTLFCKEVFPVCWKQLSGIKSLFISFREFPHIAGYDALLAQKEVDIHLTISSIGLPLHASFFRALSKKNRRKIKELKMVGSSQDTSDLLKHLQDYAPNIETLYIEHKADDLEFTEQRIQLDLSACTQLRVLTIRDAETAGVETLRLPPHIEEIVLSCGALTSLTTASGTPIRSIQKLSLYCCLKLKTLAGLFSKNTPLTELTLLHCWELEQIGWFPPVKKLDISGCTELDPEHAPWILDRATRSITVARGSHIAFLYALLEKLAVQGKRNTESNTPPESWLEIIVEYETYKWDTGGLDYQGAREAIQKIIRSPVKILQNTTPHITGSQTPMSRSVDTRRAGNTPPELHSFTKIYDPNREKVNPAEQRHGIFTGFQLDKEGRLYAVEAGLTPSYSPVPFASHSATESTHYQAETLLHCRYQEPIPLPGLTAYDTLIQPAWPVAYDAKTARYFVVPNAYQTGNRILQYAFVRSNASIFLPPQAMPLLLEFEQGFATLITHTESIRKTHPACAVFLEQLEKYKADTPVTPEETTACNALVHAYFNAFENPIQPDVLFPFFQEIHPDIAALFDLFIKQNGIDGVCRHRAWLALACYQYLCLPAWAVENDLHVFLECNQFQAGENTPRWLAMDLGGGRATIVEALTEQMRASTHLFLPTPDQLLDQEEKEEEEEVSLPAETAEYEALFEPISQKIIAAHGSTESLLQWCLHQKRVLIETGSFEQSQALYQAMYPLAAKHAAQGVMYIESAEELQRFMETITIADGEIKEGEIFLSITDHLIINWGRFSPAEMANYKSLFDSPPTMDEKSFPARIKITNLMHKESICESFTSRFKADQKIIWPHTHPIPPILLSDLKEAEGEIHTEDAYVSFWESPLLGNIEVTRDSYTFSPGALITAIQTGKRGFVLLDPPSHSPEFEATWLRLITERRVWNNDHWLAFPAGFSVQRRPAPEKILDKIQHITLEEKKEAGEEVQESPVEILDPALRNRIEKLDLFLTYFSKMPQGKSGISKEAYCSDARYQKALDALEIWEKNPTRNNPIKDIFLHDYGKHTENYAFLNVIAKIIFEPNTKLKKESVRLEKLEKLPKEPWQWRHANCFSGAALRALLGSDIQKICAEIPAQNKMQQLPALSQEAINTLKTALQFAEKGEKKKSAFVKSMQRMEDALRTYHAVVLKGPPGSGKTHAAECYANQPGRKCYWGKEAIAAWRAHDMSTGIIPVLVIDEANLEPIGSLNAIYPISDGRQVIFTANPESDSKTRTLDPLLQDQVTVYVKAWSAEERIDKLLMPLANVLTWPATLNKATLCQALVTALETVKAYGAENQFSTRDLQQMLLRLEHRLHAHPGVLWQSLLVSVVCDEWRDLIQDQEGFEEALCNQFGCNQASVPEISSQTRAVLDSLKAKGHYTPKGREEGVQLLLEDILLQQRKQELAPALAGIGMRAESVGKSGLLMEGSSGMGKSTVLQHIFSVLGIDFVQLTVGNHAATVRALLQAFHAGKAVILDESNLDPELESLLNQLLTGKTKEGKFARKPGFFVAATQNDAATHAGRSALSAAFYNRFHCMYPKDYTKAELLEMAKEALPPGRSAQTYVETYLRKRAKYPREINTRSFFLGLRTLCDLCAEADDVQTSALWQAPIPISLEDGVFASASEITKPGGFLRGRSFVSPLNSNSLYRSPSNLSRDFLRDNALTETSILKGERYIEAAMSEPFISSTASMLENVPQLPTTSPYLYATGISTALWRQVACIPEEEGTSSINTQVAGQLSGSTGPIFIHRPAPGVMRKIHDSISTTREVYETTPVQPTPRNLSTMLKKVREKERGAILIESKDPQCVRKVLQTQIPEACFFPISTGEVWSNLFEEMRFFRKKPFRFQHRYPAVIQALLEGKTVVLHGHLPKEIATQLMSLFDPIDPYLSLNGEGISIPGRLLLVTHPLEYMRPFSFAPDRMHHVTTESIAMQSKRTAVAASAC